MKLCGLEETQKLLSLSLMHILLTPNSKTLLLRAFLRTENIPNL